MKLSSRIKKTAPHFVNGSTCPRTIVIMLDGKRIRETDSWTIADADHYTLTSVHSCKYLKQESPVINCRGEIIFHYTSTTYRDWCKA